MSNGSESDRRTFRRYLLRILQAHESQTTTVGKETKYHSMDPLIKFKTTAPKFLALVLCPAIERSGGFDSAAQRAGRANPKRER
jgi:hypothetical protein